MRFILSVALSSNAMINAPALYYCFQRKNEMRYFPFHIYVADYDAGNLIAAPLLRKTTGFSACTPHRGLRVSPGAFPGLLTHLCCSLE